MIKAEGNSDERLDSDLNIRGSNALQKVATPQVSPATGTFSTRYSGTRSADTGFYNGAYQLSDSTRQSVIWTRSLRNSTSYWYEPAKFEISDNNNIWTTGEHGGDSTDMALDVHWALQEIYDHLYNTHGVIGFDNPASGPGFTIEALVKYGYYLNDRDEAFWSTGDHVLVFGGGGNNYKPTSDLGTVAHEYGHGITQFQIYYNWVTDGLSRQMFREGLSDIWSAILVNRIKPGSDCWKIANQSPKYHECVRDISNPTNINASTQIADTYNSWLYNDPNSDGYVRSGVFSRWAYLLANGGSGANGVWNLYRVYGVGMDVLENLIVESVFNGYLNYTTTWDELRTATVNAAKTFCGGTNGFLVQQVENAWYAVGVGSQPSQITFTGHDFVCSTETFAVSNLPSGSTVSWGSSNPSVLSINSTTGVATKAASGLATITASVSNTCGGNIQFQHLVFSGTPDNSKIYVTDANGNLPIVLDNYGTISAKAVYQDYFPAGAVTQFEWDVFYGNVTQSTWLQFPAMKEVDIYYANGSNPPTQQVYIRAKNVCGWGEWDELIWSVDNWFFFSYVVYPNPATDQLQIEFERTDNLKGLPKTINLFSDKSTIPVKEIVVEEAYRKQLISDNKLMIDVSELSRGVYFLHVSYGDKKEKEIHRILLR